MSKIMRLTATLFTAIVGIAALAAPASAQRAANVGPLSCTVASGVGFVFGSSEALNCTFADLGGVQQYAANIAKFGANVGDGAKGVSAPPPVIPVTTTRPRPFATPGFGGAASATSNTWRHVSPLIGSSLT